MKPSKWALILIIAMTILLSFVPFSVGSVSAHAPGLIRHRAVPALPYQVGPTQRRGHHAPPVPLATGPLLYHNGPVQIKHTVHLIFWGPAWLKQDGSLVLDGKIPRNYFNDVGGTSYFNILTQYYSSPDNGITKTFIRNQLNFDYVVDTSTPPTDSICVINNQIVPAVNDSPITRA